MKDSRKIEITLYISQDQKRREEMEKMSNELADEWKQLWTSLNRKNGAA